MAMATRAEYEDARRQLTETLSADGSLDYAGDSGRVAFGTARGARSGELRRRRPADTSLALAGDATVAVSPRRGGVPGTFEDPEPQPEPAPALDDAPPLPPSAERTFVGRPRTPGKKLAVETTTVGTPEGYRRDTSFQDRVMQTGRYAPGPLTPGDTTADSIDAIGADLSPIAMQSDISAADVSSAVGVLSEALAEGRAEFDDYAARIDAGEFDSSEDEAPDDEASDDDGFDTSSENDDGFDTSSEHEDDPPAIAGPRGAVGPRGAPGVPGAAAPAAVRDRWDRASLDQRLALARRLMADPAIAKLVVAGVIKLGDLVDKDGAINYRAMQKVRGSLVQMEEDAAESYRQAVSAKGFDRSGEQAAVIRGLNSTIPGNRSIGGTKYVIWQGATYSDEG